MFRSYSIILILILCFSVPIVFLSGGIDDFSYQHIGLIEKYMNTGHIPATEPLFANQNLGLSAYYAYGIVLAVVANISSDLLPNLPIAYISLIAILFALLKNYTQNILWVSLVILIITTYTTNINYFYFHAHGIGLVLFLCLLLLIKIMYQHYPLNGFYICTVLVICTISYLSYKSFFWTIILVTSILFLSIIYSKINFNFFQLNKKMLMITTTATIIALYLNDFFYSYFLPMIKYREEFYFTMDTFLRFFTRTDFDVLEQYNLTYEIPGSLIFFIVIRQIIVFFALLIIIVILFHPRKIVERDIHFVTVIALIVVGTVNLVFYNLLGLFDIKLLTYFIIISIIYTENRINNNVKIIINLVLYSIVVLNIICLFGAIYYEDVQKDDRYFDYIQPSAIWYITYYEPDTIAMTDVLTKGYYYKEIAKTSENNDLYPIHFDTNNILLLIGKQMNEKKINTDENIIYVVNYNLNKFSITNWRILKSLRYVKQDIERNNLISKIYSSSDKIAIYDVTP